MMFLIASVRARRKVRIAGGRGGAVAEHDPEQRLQVVLSIPR